jgi:hypothetical protein
MDALSRRHRDDRSTLDNGARMITYNFIGEFEVAAVLFTKSTAHFQLL